MMGSQVNVMSEAAAVANRKTWRPLAITAGVAGILLAATIALWAYSGTTVFYEMILTGIAMCL
jgi:hypothetical protein